jgi:hypothetical protein
MQEKPGILRGEIQHYTYRSLSDYLRRLETYSNLAAFDCRQKGKCASPRSLLGNPTAAFIRSYLVKRGFLDGTPGFAAAVMGAVSVFSYAKLTSFSGKTEHRSQEPGVRSQKSGIPCLSIVHGAIVCVLNCSNEGSSASF